MDIENVAELDVSIENNEENISVDVSEAGPQGLSAYDVYVKNGGLLTEEAWLESLKGQNGSTPIITIGTTQTLDAGSNATVSKTGTTLNPVFSFGIPQGIQGVQGEKGDTGAKGDKGDKGDKGYTGTSALDFRVVQSLPLTNISETTIYLLRNQEVSGSNLYDEYVYTNNNWEKIGDTSVDLSNYVTKTDYATTTVGGVIIPARGMTLDNDGKTQATIISYANYPSVTDATFISKGTLEYVITGKGLVSNTNYPSGTTAGVIKVDTAVGTYVNNGLLGATTKSYANYNNAYSDLIVGKGTLENVIAGKELVNKTYVDSAIVAAIGDVLGGSY